ncbi:hypothetical protein FQR65_LT01116 [Abscondita terminalis]|nr:hypothetical protein FQR65_LT01116 [Abscondita terminalis]
MFQGWSISKTIGREDTRNLFMIFLTTWWLESCWKARDNSSDKKVTRAPSQSLPESPDASLDTILEKAGVSQRQLEDEDTRKFIYDFLNKHGGWKVVGKRRDNSSDKKVTRAPSQSLPESPDASLDTILEKAGVSQRQLEDEDTRKFIYDFLNKHGGWKVVGKRRDNSSDKVITAKTTKKTANKKVTRAPSQSLPESPDASLDTILEKAGVSQRQLEDEDTRKFIYDFLNKHGGWKVVGKRRDNSSDKNKDQDANQDNQLIEETQEKTNISDAVLESLETQDVTRENVIEPTIYSTTYSKESCESINSIQESSYKSIPPIPAPRRLIQKTGCESKNPPVPSRRNFNRTIPTCSSPTVEHQT